MYTFKNYKQPEILRNHLKLGGDNPAGERIDVTSLYITRDGKPIIPVTGEFHYSRCAREDWYDELCKMKAGGITLVSTYVFWIYHEEIEGVFDFSGDNDLRAFILECQKAGLEVVLRIGPWAHGECRNGGYPDWLLAKPFKLRENNPQYLEKVTVLYEKIAEQVQGLFYKDGGNIIAVQLENELTNDAEHLAKLKELAIACGMIAPLYTVTGWNAVSGAKIPVDEVVPVFGGYCEAPWEEHMDPLPPSPHYFFTGMRNDTGIGADLLPRGSEEDGEWQLPYERYPFATCELGGGLQVTHHRRPIIREMDIYAISLVKLGDGNNLIGYYMYHGGTNQIGKLSTFQESKATGYPNDYPILSYDFQTALSEYGEVRGQYRLLNLLHLFVQEWDQTLAPMTRVEAEHTVKREDTASLRYVMRTDGVSGFVFINHYQRLSQLEDIRGAVIDTGTVTFPPIDVSGEVSFFMPFKLELSGNILKYATAQPLCRQGNTYFFTQIPGIAAEYQFENDQRFTPEAGLISGFQVNGITIVTLTWEQAKYLRKLDGEVFVGEESDLYKADGEIRSVAEGSFGYWQWNGEGFEYNTVQKPYTEPVLSLEDVEQAPFEPKYAEELHIGGERKITWQKIKVTGSQGFVNIDYYGDTAQIFADGELVADSYYYGEVWRVPAKLLEGKECYLAVSEMRNDFYREF
ncbi:beta-galactosidase [Paenibacillus typhae]|uniref:Glycosyl hydrolases family 35 n=1 Tax=Paenibacillus typhae TaxID=1174501 RepID=A0A1G8FNC8_9BACL|nr:beta-galactosidase [Paenibacillus typhae]SDH83506.1 Glycosyl hydrolases family 35 [Paenibacillus typhae]